MTATLPASPELTDGQLIEAAIGEYIDARKIEGVTHTEAIRRAVQWALSNRHRSSPSSEWRDIKDAPKEPVGIDPQIDWNIGEHGPYILIAFDREHYPEWGASVGWWAPKWNCWRWLEDDGPNDVQPTYFQPLPEPPK